MSRRRNNQDWELSPQDNMSETVLPIYSCDSALVAAAAAAAASYSCGSCSLKWFVLIHLYFGFLKIAVT